MRSRCAHSSASTLVGSATTSVERSADSTRFWAVGAMLEHAASGATGDSSIASNPSAAASRWPSIATLSRWSIAAGWQNGSR